jgi:hypothetical protein
MVGVCVRINSIPCRFVSLTSPNIICFAPNQLGLMLRAKLQKIVIFNIQYRVFTIIVTY